MMTLLLILALLCAFVVFRVLTQYYQTRQCPEPETLRDFFYGRLKRYPDLHRRIISHLGYCERCRRRLEDIQLGRDLEDHLIDEENQRN